MNRNAEMFSYQLKKERRKRTGFIILFFICLYIFINIVITYLIYPVCQNSHSMIPDVPEKSAVMVSPVVSNYSRGDIVLLKERKNVSKNFFKKQADIFVRFFTAQQISIFEKSDYHLRKPCLVGYADYYSAVLLNISEICKIAFSVVPSFMTIDFSL